MACHGRRDSITCYTRSQLVDLATFYNSRYSHRIPLNGNKAALWSALSSRMIESQWGGTAKPPAPKGRGPGDERPWLSTKDIHAVLNQFQMKYPDFQAIGPVPMDFCNIGHVLCKMDVVRAYKKGIRTIGVVFNTDPSHLPGKHWISMFIDMRRDVWEIDYFDSFGNAMVAPEIVRLVTHLEANMVGAGVRVVKKLNCSDTICTSGIQHQMNDSDCGMYSIHFIVKRLEGESWESLVKAYSRELNDDNMGKMRKHYFRY